jgi:hypothetical protein
MEKKWLIIGTVAILVIVILIIVIIIIWEIRKYRNQSTSSTNSDSVLSLTPQNGSTPSNGTTDENPTTESLVQNLQSNAGRLSINGKCLYLDAPIKSGYNYPSIKSGYLIKLTPCNNNETRQVWIMDNKQRLTLENSDRTHCIRINGADGMGYDINGKNVVIWGCIDEPMQIWRPIPNKNNNSTFKLADPTGNYCLSAGLGDKPVINPCSMKGTSNNWTFTKK